jgi:hypothetical protein
LISLGEVVRMSTTTFFSLDCSEHRREMERKRDMPKTEEERRKEKRKE